MTTNNYNSAVDALTRVNDERIIQLRDLLETAKSNDCRSEYIIKLQGSLEEALFQQRLLSIWQPKESEVEHA